MHRISTKVSYKFICPIQQPPMNSVLINKSRIMSTVKIAPGKTGNLVSTYTNNPEFGYIQLTSSDISVSGGWIRESKRSCLLRAKTQLLNQFVAMHKSLEVPGKIAVLEYLEDNIPAEIQKEFLRNDLPFEEAISGYLKRAGQDGPALTYEGKRIVRFSKYDPAGQVIDVHIAHDNVNEVATFKSSSDSAAFPG